MSAEYRHVTKMNIISAPEQRAQTDQSGMTPQGASADGLDAEPESVAEISDTRYQQWHTQNGHHLEHMIHDDRWLDRLSSGLVQLCSELVDDLAAQLDKPVLNISVCWTDNKEITQHNSQFRQKPSATNILSFPSGDEPEIGDLVLGFETVMHEAEQMGISPEHHIAHLLVHGILHLLGYDHIDDKDAIKMEGLETALLVSHGIANPYDGAEIGVLRS